VRCTFASPNAWTTGIRRTEADQSLVALPVVFPRRDRLRASAGEILQRARASRPDRAAHRSVSKRYRAWVCERPYFIAKLMLYAEALHRLQPG